MSDEKKPVKAKVEVKSNDSVHYTTVSFKWEGVFRTANCDLYSAKALRALIASYNELIAAELGG